MSSSKETHNPAKTRLTKSKDDRVIDGVCGGLAEYFEIDSVIVRLAFFIFTFINGFGILLYIILMIIMPKPDSNEQTQPSKIIEENVQRMGEQVKDIIENIGEQMDESAGEKITGPDQKMKKSHERSKWFGALLILLGIFFLLDELNLFWWFNEDLFLPLLLILIGIWMLIKRGDR
ncbi:MAG: PspC domain-containing protein [Methanosarcinaceae archaeon]|nr:PspC domain-containing protein [Methanosarcinaceae archaeon]